MEFANIKTTKHLVTSYVMDINYVKVIQWLMLTLGSIFIGFLTATEHYLIAGFIFSLIVVPLLTILIISNFGSKQDLIFWLLYVAIMLSSLGSALTRSSWTFLPTGLLLLSSPFIVYSIFQESQGFKKIKLPLFLIVFFYFWSLLSSIFGRSAFFPAVYSLVTSLKPFLLIGLGAALVWSDRTQRSFNWIVKWSWLPLLTVALIQWFLPSIFNLIVMIDAESPLDSNPFFPGYPRATSLFGHPSILAAYSSILALILLANAIFNKKLLSCLNSAFYVLLLLMTGQRQEVLAFFTCIPLIYIMYKFKPNFLLMLLVSFTGLASILLLINFFVPELIQNEMANWNIGGTNLVDMSARAALYSDSFQIANKYWPWGSGLGTFASIGAVKFDQSLYVDLGYRAFWWYKQQKSWLMDAYWAKYIAESGWIGFCITIALYIVLLRKVTTWIADSAIRTSPETLKTCVIAFIGLFYVLITSPTAFNLAEAHGGLIPMMFLGIAWRQVNALRNSNMQVISF